MAVVVVPPTELVTLSGELVTASGLLSLCTMVVVPVRPTEMAMALVMMSGLLSLCMMAVVPVPPTEMLTLLSLWSRGRMTVVPGRFERRLWRCTVWGSSDLFCACRLFLFVLALASLALPSLCC